MCRLFETIKIFNKTLFNLNLHNERMNNSRKELFDCRSPINLCEEIHLPSDIGNDMYKCRIIYSREIETIEFIPYTKKKIEIIKLVECDAIEYNHKYFNRKIFDDLLAESGADEILIIKEGKITDTSYSNIAFYDGNKWLTPSTPLLKGTKREKLLREGKIFKAEIVKNDLQYFQSASLINAMMDLGELVIDLKILNLAQTKFCPTKILP